MTAKLLAYITEKDRIIIYLRWSRLGCIAECNTNAIKRASRFEAEMVASEI